MPEENPNVSTPPKPTRTRGKNLLKVAGISSQSLALFEQATKELIDCGFYEYLDGKYGRLAEYVLARVACSGDVKALQLYLDRVDARRKAKEQPTPPKPVGSVAFLPAPRNTSTSSEQPSSDARESASSVVIESYDDDKASVGGESGG